jgi:hypothetical protein
MSGNYTHGGQRLVDVVLSPHDQRRLLTACASMPYTSYSATMRPLIVRDGAIDADSLIMWLENLAERLRQHATDYRQLDAEHTALENDVAAVRRVLGTDVLSLTDRSQ